MTAQANNDFLSKKQEQDLWSSYVRTRDNEVRARLVDNYLGIAKKVAARLFAHRTDESLEFCDYLQYARTGLLEAIDRFDPSKDASFATFATYRMQGAILNGIEKHNERLAQWAYQKRASRDRMDSLASQSDAEEDKDLFAQMTGVAIGLAVGHILESTSIDDIEDESQEKGPYDSLELMRLREQLRLVVDSLPDRERQIITYHYFEHIPFAEIATFLGLSKGRVSQLHARALGMIRKGYECIGALDLSF